MKHLREYNSNEEVSVHGPQDNSWAGKAYLYPDEASLDKAIDLARHHRRKYEEIKSQIPEKFHHLLDEGDFGPGAAKSGPPYTSTSILVTPKADTHPQVKTSDPYTKADMWK